MAYTHQIRILEAKLKQLQRGPHNTENNLKVLQIQAEVKKLERLEWEENYERLKLEEDR